MPCLITMEVSNGCEMNARWRRGQGGPMLCRSLESPLTSPILYAEGEPLRLCRRDNSTATWP
jgi:hypothetical protein